MPDILFPDPPNPDTGRGPAPHRPALVRRNEAAHFCGMGLPTFDRHDAAGLVPAGRRVGGCKVWSVAELKAWAEHGCPERTSWAPIWRALLAVRRARTE
jgi:predicted DNA-binding transcriptional regulator AlpA